MTASSFEGSQLVSVWGVYPRGSVPVWGVYPRGSVRARYSGPRVGVVRGAPRKVGR